MYVILGKSHPAADSVFRQYPRSSSALRERHDSLAQRSCEFRTETHRLRRLKNTRALEHGCDAGRDSLRKGGGWGGGEVARVRIGRGRPVESAGVYEDIEIYEVVDVDLGRRDMST